MKGHGNIVAGNAPKLFRKTGSDLRDFCVCSSSSKEAGAAEDGTPLRRVERNSCLLSALGALYRDFYTLSHSRRLRGCNCCEPFIFGLFARLTSFRFVL